MDESSITVIMPSDAGSVCMKISNAWFSPSGRLNHRDKSVDNPHLTAFNVFFLPEIIQVIGTAGCGWTVVMPRIEVQWANASSRDYSDAT